MRVAVLFVVACAFACGKKTEPKAGSGSADKPTTSAPAADAVKVTRDGQPVTVAHAYAKKLGHGERYQVLLTDKDSTCGELVDNVFNKREGEHKLLFDIGERIAPDGTLSGVVTQFYDPKSVTLDPGSKVSVKGSEFAVDFTAKTGSADLASVHGTFKAEDCGLHPRDDGDLPKAKHASTATIDIAGKKLPLVGAVLLKDDVMLSTSPKACNGFLPAAQVMVWRQGKFWSARGEWFDHEVGNHEAPDPKTQDLKIERGATGTSDDGPTVQLTLSGKGTIDQYPITLAGTIEALDCKETAMP